MIVVVGLLPLFLEKREIENFVVWNSIGSFLYFGDRARVEFRDGDQLSLGYSFWYVLNTLIRGNIISGHEKFLV